MNTLNKLNAFYDYKKCNHNFSFKNVFHKHLKTCLLKIYSKKSTTEHISSNIVFSNSIFSVEFRININIKTWRFLTIKVSINIKSTIIDLCVNIDCETFMTNRIFVFTMLTNYVSKIKITALLKIKDINDAIIFSTKAIVLNYSFFEIIKEKFVIVKLFREVRIVNNFQLKFL